MQRNLFVFCERKKTDIVCAGQCSEVVRANYPHLRRVFILSSSGEILGKAGGQQTQPLTNIVYTEYSQLTTHFRFYIRKQTNYKKMMEILYLKYAFESVYTLYNVVL